MPPARVIERLHQRVTIAPNGCWIWQGGLASGYGRMGWREGGKARFGAVHRITYTEAHGPVPEGLDLDHLCHDPETCTVAAECQHRRCCNPAHLEAVSRKENLSRGGGISAERAARTHCPEGHEYDAVNTFVDKQGRRSCRECTRIANRAYYHQNKARRSEYNRAWREARKSAI